MGRCRAGEQFANGDGGVGQQVVDGGDPRQRVPGDAELQRGVPGDTLGGEANGADKGAGRQPWRGEAEAEGEQRERPRQAEQAGVAQRQAQRQPVHRRAHREQADGADAQHDAPDGLAAVLPGQGRAEDLPRARIHQVEKAERHGHRHHPRDRPELAPSFPDIGEHPAPATGAILPGTAWEASGQASGEGEAGEKHSGDEEAGRVQRDGPAAPDADHEQPPDGGPAPLPRSATRPAVS